MRGSLEDSDALAAKQARLDYLRSILAFPICKQSVNVVSIEEKFRWGLCAEEHSVVGNVPIMLKTKPAQEIEAMLFPDRDSERMHQEFYDSWSKSERIYRAIQLPQVNFGLAKVTRITQFLNRQGEDAWGLEIGSRRKRYHQRLINLEICPFPEVDVVGMGEPCQRACNNNPLWAVLDHAQYRTAMVEEM